MPADTTGVIGRAKYFNGGSDTGVGQRDTSYYIIPSSAVNSKLGFQDTNGTYVISAWINSDTIFAIPGRDRSIVDKGNNQYNLQMGSADPTNTPSVPWPNFGYVDVSKSWRATFSQASARTWRYVAAVHNGTRQYTFVDGIATDSTIKYYGTGGTNRITSDTVAIAALSTSTTKGAFFKGYIDEARIENVARSPDWIKLSFANQKIGSTMLTSGTPLISPPTLTYSALSPTYTVGMGIPPDTALVTGIVDSFTISPTTLPAGLFFDKKTGIINGLPTAAQAQTADTVVAYNAGGTGMVVLKITIVSTLAAPTNLKYTTPVTYTVGAAITPNLPSSQGGAVASYAISPSLTSTGLTFSTTTGVISGTPTGVIPATNYMVTAANATGSTTASVSITINPAAPTNLTYSKNTVTFIAGAAITPDSAFVTGVVDSFTASSLPLGLVIDKLKGTMSGIPLAAQGQLSYVITARNVSGVAIDTLKISVNPAPPKNLTYSTPTPIYYTVNVPIAQNIPSSQGGAPTSYHASLLPAGLQIDTTTGIITGKPTTIGSANYTITAANAGGSTSAILAITVSAPNANPITIAGSYISATQVKIILGKYSSLSAISPPVDSVLVLWKKNGFPDSVSGATIKSYALSALAAGGLDTIALTFPNNTFLPTDSVGIGSAIIWFDNSRTVSSPANDAKIAMRDTTTPGNGLLISGVWDSGTTIANIYIDSVSAKTIDTTIKSISIWYGSANAGYFTNDQTANFTKTISAATILSAAKNGRYTDYDTSFLLGGQPKTIYCAVRLNGQNGLSSLPSLNFFSVGNNLPQNPLKLSATRSSTDSTGSIVLNWSPVQYSVRVWYGVNQALLTADPNDLSLGITSASLPTDSSVTVSNLRYGTTYYFGAQALINGAWTALTQQSIASATTGGVSDTTTLKNTAKVIGDTLDSLTHVITVRWTVDTTGLSGKSLQIGMVYSLKGWPLDPTQFPTTIKPIKGAAGVDTLKLSESLVFDTTYYIGLWLRTTNGAWFPATDTTAMNTLRTSSFTWQNFSYGNKSIDYVFNQKIRLIDSNEITTTGIIDYSQPSVSALQGFIQVSIGFNFSGSISGPAFWVGLHVDSIPALFSSSQIRMYRYDALSNTMLLDTNKTVFDAQGQYFSIKTNHLTLPFIALIDTMSPVVTAMPLGISRDSAVVGGHPVVVSFAVSDNISNAKYRLQYTVGGNSYGVDTTTHTDTIETKQIDTLRDTIKDVYVSSATGLRACLIASDGVHFDTTDLSCPAIRQTNSDLTSTLTGMWKPLFATATPDSLHATYALRGLDKKGVWNYDPTQFRLFRYASGGSVNDTNKWSEYSKVPDSVFLFYPGRLMWIKTQGSYKIDFDRAVTLSLKVPDTIVVQPKWSDIALPYNFSIKVGDIVHATVAAGQRGDTLQYYSWAPKDTIIMGKKTTQYQTKQLFIYDALATVAGAPVADSTDSIVQIAAVYNPLPVPVKLIVPPIPTSMSSIMPALATAKKKTTFKGWSLGISGRTLGGITLNTVYCGYISGKGTSGYYPPAPTFSTVVMSVFDERKRRCGNILTYGNWNKDGGTSFDLAFANTGENSEHITLGAAKFGAIPNGNFRIALFDPATGTLCDTLAAMSVTVGAGACEYRKLIVGNDAYLAKVRLGGAMYQLSLIGAYPNPFKRSLRIQYSIPGKNIRNVDFSITDLSGREIWKTTLASDVLTAGPGVLAWNGKSKDNAPAAAGLYVVRMRAFDMQGKTSGVFEKRITYMP
jgi:hypothetical protein